jgi:hypothetical protein
MILWKKKKTFEAYNKGFKSALIHTITEQCVCVRERERESNEELLFSLTERKKEKTKKVFLSFCPTKRTFCIRPPPSGERVESSFCFCCSSICVRSDVLQLRSDVTTFFSENFGKPASFFSNKCKQLNTFHV